MNQGNVGIFSKRKWNISSQHLGDWDAISIWMVVLGSAGIELIFTRSQKGTETGWLTQTGQTKKGIHRIIESLDTMCRHAQFGVGELDRVRLIASVACAGHVAVRELLCVFPCSY